MTEMFYYGYHLTRFLYARDEVLASYLCNLYETEEPYNHQHFYFLAELTESGFHGDAMVALLRGMTLKVVCAGEKSEQLREWFAALHGHMADLHPSAGSSLDLTACDNDLEADTPMSDAYDAYKYALYSLSNLVQHFGCPVISMRQVRALMQGEKDDKLPMYQFMGKRQPWREDFPHPDEYLLLRKLQLCCKQGGGYQQLYNQCYNVVKSVLKEAKEECDAPGGLPRADYFGIAQSMLSSIERFARDVLGVHDYIDFSTWLDAISHTHAAYTHAQTGDELEDARMLTRAQLRVLVTSVVFLQAAHIVSECAEAARPAPAATSELDALCDQMAGAGVADADEEKRCRTSSEDRMAYDDIANPVEELDMMFIEGLRNTPYDTFVQTGDHTIKDGLFKTMSIRKLLKYRLCVPIHAFVKFFPTKRAKRGITQEESMAIRTEEWVHYCVFTPLWRRRFQRAVEEAHGEGTEIPFDTESCEMETEKLPCGGECFAKWDMGFEDLRYEYKYYVVYSAYDHSEERLRGEERVLDAMVRTGTANDNSSTDDRYGSDSSDSDM